MIVLFITIFVAIFFAICVHLFFLILCSDILKTKIFVILNNIPLKIIQKRTAVCIKWFFILFCVTQFLQFFLHIINMIFIINLIYLFNIKISFGWLLHKYIYQLMQQLVFYMEISNFRSVLTLIMWIFIFIDFRKNFNNAEFLL